PGYLTSAPGRGIRHAMRRAARPLVALALVLLHGCAAFRTLARPDPEPAPAAAPWTVRCTWVEHRPAGAEQDLGPADHGALWAQDPNGRRVVIRGGLEDGFLRVDALAAWTPERGDEELGVAPSVDALRWLCADTVARELAGRDVTVDRIAAARADENVDVAMALADDLPGAPKTTAKRIVVFGDSLSDPGNLKRRLLVFPNAPYYLGRFSDGPNWAQYLAERTSLPVYNHAVGGAVSVEHADVPASGILSAVQQGAQFLLTGSVEEYVTHYLTRDLSDGQLQRTNDTVFVLWSGGNDYLSKEPISGDIDTLLDEPHEPSGYLTVVDQTTTAIANQVRRLYAAGGRRFVVMTLPDLGTIPGVLHNDSYRADEEGVSEAMRRAQLSRKMSQLTRHHNDQLADKIADVRRELPGASITLLDTQQAIASILAGRLPAPREGRSRGAGSGSALAGQTRFAYGFDLRTLRSTALRDRKGVIPIQDRCYRGGYLGTGDAENVCVEEAKVFFWDMVHPTSYTHCWLSFFVQRELATAGLIAGEPDPVAHRAYCARRQELLPQSDALREPVQVSAP
ncbi:SGNH/GDSL hydrolase family protein, partial [Candidatus Binatia bacterium]|nr:SGNH/GDSL hydrolase family protein [Candidatus Binatia bacterium]